MNEQQQPKERTDRFTDCNYFSDEDYPACDYRGTPCKFKRENRCKCEDYISVIHHQVICDVRQGTAFAQQMISDATGEPIRSRPHPAPAQEQTHSPCFSCTCTERECPGYECKRFDIWLRQEHDAAIERKAREEVLDEANKELDSDECPPSVDPKDCEGDCVRCILNTLRHSTQEPRR